MGYGCTAEGIPEALFRRGYPDFPGKRREDDGKALPAGAGARREAGAGDFLLLGSFQLSD